MEPKIKTTNTEEDFQTCNNTAKEKAIMKCDEDLSCHKVYHLELVDAGHNKLKKDLNQHFGMHENEFIKHKIFINQECDKAVENALSSYDDEMEPKIKTTNTEEDFQTCNNTAKAKAIKKYDDEVSCHKDYNLKLVDEGRVKLEK
ncbi:unnamed protein product, partial [Meganyctiphanes norvegica]